MSLREDSQEPSTSAATTSREPRDGNRENPGCPVCQDINTKCSSSCRHCFCHLCLWDWGLSDAVCPQCQRPIRHTYPQHVALYHEVQDRVYNSKQRRHSRSEQRSWSCSEYSNQDGPPERGRKRSVRGHRDGHWWSWCAHRSNSSRRRRQQWSRDWDNAPDKRRAPMSERAIPGSSCGRRSRHRFRRTWSQDQQEQPQRHQSRQRFWSRDRDRSHGWDRQHSHGWDRQRSHGWDRQLSRSHRQGQDTWTQSHGTEPHDHSTRQRHWRSRNADEGRTPRHQQDIPAASGRSRYQPRTQSPAGHKDPIAHPPKE